MNIEFDSAPVYGDNDNDKNIKTKKMYENKVKGNSKGNSSYDCH